MVESENRRRMTSLCESLSIMIMKHYQLVFGRFRDVTGIVLELWPPCMHPLIVRPSFGCFDGGRPHLVAYGTQMCSHLATVCSLSVFPLLISHLPSHGFEQSLFPQYCTKFAPAKRISVFEQQQQPIVCIHMLPTQSSPCCSQPWGYLSSM